MSNHRQRMPLIAGAKCRFVGIGPWDTVTDLTVVWDCGDGPTAYYTFFASVCDTWISSSVSARAPFNLCSPSKDQSYSTSNTETALHYQPLFK